MAGSKIPPRILPAHIEDTIRSISELHADHHRRATPMQRVVRKSVRLIGQPRFIAFISILLLMWVGANILLGPRAVDPAPFPWLQEIGTGLGVYIMILILITQRHEDELAELREQLTLELAILSEQKTAKLVQLLEELRRDNPLIADRIDPVAAALSVPANPETVLDVLRETNEEITAAIDIGADQEPKANNENQ